MKTDRRTSTGSPLRADLAATAHPVGLGPFPVRILRTSSPHPRAFTLLEVMIAMGIFFLAIFAILDLTTQNIRAARSLKQTPVDFTSVVSDMLLTNRLEEGSETGDLGDMYPGYVWSRETFLVSTNGLFQVEVTVSQPTTAGASETHLSLLLYRPDSPLRPGSFR